MAYGSGKKYDNNNRGTLGKNKRREKEDHPEYTGQCTIDGKSFWINAWVNENGETKEKFFSLSFRPKEEQRDDRSSGRSGGGNGNGGGRGGRGGFDDDSIPF